MRKTSPVKTLVGLLQQSWEPTRLKSEVTLWRRDESTRFSLCETSRRLVRNEKLTGAGFCASSENRRNGMTNWMEKVTLALAAGGTLLGLAPSQLQAQDTSGKKPNVVFIQALLYGDWKVTFATRDSWWADVAKPRTVPLVVNLRQDPFEVTSDSKMYEAWYGDKLWVMIPAQAIVGQFLMSFKEFPQWQNSASFTLNESWIRCSGKPTDAVRLPAKGREG